MQIAPVSVVFALATAGALGMAVRATITGAPSEAVAETVDEYASATEQDLEYQREIIADMEREAEEETRREQAIATARTELVRDLFGTEVASRGPRWGTLEVGMSSERFAVAQYDEMQRLEQSTAYLESSGGARVSALIIGAVRDSQDLCDEALESLTTRWNEPVMIQDESYAWWNPTTGDRVRVDSRNACQLVFDRAVSVEAWSTQAVALGKLKTERDVQRAVAAPSADSQDRNDSAQWWELPGLEHGEGPTSVYVEYDDQRKVKTVVISTRSAAGSAVRSKLTDALGSYVAHDEELIDWPAKKVRLATPAYGLVEVTFGVEVAE